MSVQAGWLMKKKVFFHAKMSSMTIKKREVRKWSCLWKTCSRSRIFILWELLVALWIVCFRSKSISKVYDESTVWMKNFCSAAGYVSALRGIMNKLLFKKRCVCTKLVEPPETEEHNFATIGWKTESFLHYSTKFLSSQSTVLRRYGKKIENRQFFQGADFYSYYSCRIKGTT